MTNTPTTFEEFFDAHIPAHRDAYRSLHYNGTWPTSFIPDDIDMGTSWIVVAQHRMLDFYIKHSLITTI